MSSPRDGDQRQHGSRPVGSHQTAPQPALPDPPPPHRGSRFATGASLVAVVVAVLALAVAVLAYGRSGNDGTTIAAQPATITAPPATPEPPSSSPPVTVGSDSADAPGTSSSAPGDDPIPTPSEEPRLAYPDRQLKMPPGCSGRSTVDVDEPRVNGNDPEIGDIGCNGAGLLDFFVGVQYAKVGSQTASALDCLNEIRDAPLNGRFTPTVGQTLCVVTSSDNAQKLGGHRKVARLTIRDIGDDGTLTLLVTAWILPN